MAGAEALPTRLVIFFARSVTPGLKEKGLSIKSLRSWAEFFDGGHDRGKTVKTHRPPGAISKAKTILSERYD